MPVVLPHVVIVIYLSDRRYCGYGSALATATPPAAAAAAAAPAAATEAAPPAAGSAEAAGAPAGEGGGDFYAAQASTLSAGSNLEGHVNMVSPCPRGQGSDGLSFMHYRTLCIGSMQLLQNTRLPSNSLPFQAWISPCFCIALEIELARD